MNRRDAIIAGLGTPLLAGCNNLSGTAAANMLPSGKSGGYLVPENMGIDRNRAAYILKQAGLDAVIVQKPENIYYATGYWAALVRAGLTGTTFAIIPQDANAPICFVCSQFTYYYTIADIELAPNVEPYLSTWEMNNEVADAMLFSQTGEITNKEQRRINKTMDTKPFHGSSGKAILAALSDLGIQSGKLGYDSLESKNQLETVAPKSDTVWAENAIKHMRLIKTPREITLMRQASANNIAAALATAKVTRDLATSGNVRNHFMAEAAKLGNRYEFMVVNSSINQLYDEPLQDGTTVLIDCVSSFQGYWGDYGRTIFIGEPLKKMSDKVSTMGQAWNELKTTFRPGMAFSEIQKTGAEILKKMDTSISVPFSPHSVGLAHTEQPKFELDGSRADLKLEPGMIISVDCPLMETSSMGSAHLEDLTLITESGSEPIHDPGNQIIIA